MNQRIIKFRAWNKEYKKLFAPDEEQNLDLLPIWIRNPEVYNLMQFTGLLDKNGKEIYEGDIVKEVLRDHEHILKVHFEGQSWYPFALDDMEVIGNIYEGLHSGEKLDMIDGWKNNTNEQSQKLSKDILSVKKREEKSAEQTEENG